jgi:hypothetical protein
MLGNWARIWLHTGTPESLHLVDIQDEPGGDKSQVEQTRWAGVPFSASLIEAFKFWPLRKQLTRYHSI